MIKMKIVGSLIVSVVLGFAQLAEPQQAKRIPLIGYLALGTGPGEPEAQFKDRLRALGWFEGQNIAIEYRWSGNDLERLRLLAEELVRMKVDLIVASATPVIEAARKATTTIPIVMLGAADPVASGFVASLAHPGGNVTGLSLQSAELSGKRLELLKEIVPKLSRVALLLYGGDPAHKLFLKEAQDVAPILGIKIHPIVIQQPAEMENAFSAMKRPRAQALVVQPILSGALMGQGSKIAQLAVKNKSPTISDSVRFTEAGGLISYGADRLDLYRRAAVHVVTNQSII